MFGIALLFVALGAICVTASNEVVEVKYRYDNDAACESGFFATDAEKANQMSATGAGVQCSITMKIPDKMKAPVYVYYELDNFYQNHRRYVKSRSETQLNGGDTEDDFCEPQLYERGNASAAAADRKINPCGLIAWSYFNDTYSFEVDGSPLDVSEKGIAWKSDIEHKFGSYAPKNFNDDPATRGGGVIGAPTVKEDEHFIVWMRTAALSNFRKLWGVINADIPAGSTVTVRVNNRYNTYKFDGGKHVVLSTTSWLGGKNDFLGVAYLVIGVICAVFALVFMVFAFYPPRKHGDVHDLSWNVAAAGGGGNK